MNFLINGLHLVKHLLKNFRFPENLLTSFLITFKIFLIISNNQSKLLNFNIKFAINMKLIYYIIIIMLPNMYSILRNSMLLCIILLKYPFIKLWYLLIPIFNCDTLCLVLYNNDHIKESNLL